MRSRPQYPFGFQRDRRQWIFPTFITLFIVAILGFITLAVIDMLNQPASGYVVERAHHDAYDQLSCGGRPIICTTYHYDERWELKLKEGDADPDWKTVTEDEYSSYKVGDHYPDPR